MSAPRLLMLVGASILALAAPASAARVDRIATGLDNPRHLAFGANNNLYVAESGRGGSGPCFPGPEQSPVCVGATGAVTVIRPQRQQRRVVRGLASFANQGTGAEAIGPHGIFVDGSNRVLITNGGPTEANRDQLAAQNPVAAQFGRVLRLQRNGRVQRLLDVWGFERDNNPDAQVANPMVDSNAVDVLSQDGRLVVADAGGNSLLRTTRTGRLRVLSLFPNQTVANPMPPPPEIPMQAVPTGVVTGPRGDYFMTQLTGFPFPVGAANVFRIDRRTGRSTVFASGFTNLMDLTFDRRGTLWVLEIDHDSLFPPAGPSTDGAIFSVNRRGQKRQLSLPAGTLTSPGGITAGSDGALYVTNKGTAAGGGEVLRIRP
ncbi:MAG: hypothetical protein JWQ20_2857 [Conexibacter sp.]|nr:hypothetical protein [Conexibacter sp.]